MNTTALIVEASTPRIAAEIAKRTESVFSTKPIMIKRVSDTEFLVTVKVG